MNRANVVWMDHGGLQGGVLPRQPIDRALARRAALLDIGDPGRPRLRLTIEVGQIHELGGRSAAAIRARRRILQGGRCRTRSVVC